MKFGDRTTDLSNMSQDISIEIKIGEKSFKREGFIPVTSKGVTVGIISFHLDKLLEDLSRDILQAAEGGNLKL